MQGSWRIRSRRNGLGGARAVALEAALWAGLYGLYLIVRGATIGDVRDALAHAQVLVDVERRIGMLVEGAVQELLEPFHGVLSAYYMLGFAPVVAGVLLWLWTADRAGYRSLRTALLASIAIAAVVYVLLPVAPPRLVPGLSVADTVGLSQGHDTGSIGGVRFNPYAAMPSMHVGWSLLVGLYGARAVRRRGVRVAFAAHPLMMGVTVVATGNHFVIDVAAGIFVALVALALLPGARGYLRGDPPGHDGGRRPPRLRTCSGC